MEAGKWASFRFLYGAPKVLSTSNMKFNYSSLVEPDIFRVIGLCLLGRELRNMETIDINQFLEFELFE